MVISPDEQVPRSLDRQVSVREEPADVRLLVELEVPRQVGNCFMLDDSRAEALTEENLLDAADRVVEFWIDH